MQRVYITAKKADPKWGSFEYASIISGNPFLHYTAEDLLLSLTRYVKKACNGKVVVFRNYIPKYEESLIKTLYTMIEGHNIAVKLSNASDIDGRKIAKTLLRK